MGKLHIDQGLGMRGVVDEEVSGEASVVGVRCHHCLDHY